MANLHQDSVVSNAMSADTDFQVGYRRVALEAPFLVVCATDRCFGYLQTPMRFEHLVLKALLGARSAEAWSRTVQADIAAVTGDDAAMAVLGVGADLEAFQSLFGPRLAELEETFIAPLDRLRLAVQEAERALDAARKRHRDERRRCEVGINRTTRATSGRRRLTRQPRSRSTTPPNRTRHRRKSNSGGRRA